MNFRYAVSLFSFGLIVCTGSAFAAIGNACSSADRQQLNEQRANYNQAKSTLRPHNDLDQLNLDLAIVGYSNARYVCGEISYNQFCSQLIGALKGAIREAKSGKNIPTALKQNVLDQLPAILDEKSGECHDQANVAAAPAPASSSMQGEQCDTEDPGACGSGLQCIGGGILIPTCQ